ncbi:hypothetical protein ABK040_004320 [Willaertia magna]
MNDTQSESESYTPSFYSSENSEEESENNNLITNTIITEETLFIKIKEFYNLIFNNNNNLKFKNIKLNLDFNISNSDSIPPSPVFEEEDENFKIKNYFINKLLNVTKSIEINNTVIELCYLIIDNKLFTVLLQLNDLDLIILINKIIKNEQVESVDFKYFILLFFILYICEVDKDNILCKFINYFVNFFKINNEYYLSICKVLNFLYCNYSDLIENNNFFKNIFKKCVDHINIIRIEQKKEILINLPECVKNYFIIGFNKLNEDCDNNLYCYNDIIINNLQQKIKEEEKDLNNVIFIYKDISCYKYLIDNSQFTNNLFTTDSIIYFKQIIYLEKSINEIYSNENIYFYLDLIQLFYYFKIPFFINKLFNYIQQLLTNNFNQQVYFTILNIITEFEILNNFLEQDLNENDFGYSNFKQFLMDIHLKKIENTKESTKRLLDTILFNNKRKKL